MRRAHGERSGVGRALLGVVTVVVLAVQVAPAATGLVASMLHGVFHLSARSGYEHLESRMQHSLAQEADAHSHPHPDEARTLTSGARTHTPAVPHRHAEDEPMHVHEAPDRPPAAAYTHTHGPGQAPHSHSTVVDAALELAATSDGPAVGPAGSGELSIDRYLHPEKVRPESVASSVIRVGGTPVAPGPYPHRTPPVPPPRA